MGEGGNEIYKSHPNKVTGLNTSTTDNFNSYNMLPEVFCRIIKNLILR